MKERWRWLLHPNHFYLPLWLLLTRLDAVTAAVATEGVVVGVDATLSTFLTKVLVFDV